MKKLVLDQRTSEWHAWREQGITATESAVILGLSPHKTPWRLWAEKTHRATPVNLDNVPQVRFGRDNEDKVRQLFEQAHDEIVSPACAVMDGDELFRASFDGLTLNDIPVEIKCPGSNTLDDVLENGEQSEAYKLYFVQVQHQMMVAGAPHAWLVFFDGRDPMDERLIEFQIQRDDAFIAKLKEEGHKFWEFVSKKKDPPMDKERDVYFPSGDDVVLWKQAATDYLEVERHIKKLSEKIEELKGVQSKTKESLSKLMGDHCLAEFAGVRVKKSMRQGSVDLDALLKAHGLDKSVKEAFRKKPSETWSFTGTERLFPDGVNATEEEIHTLEEAEDSPDLWFD